MPLPKSFDDLLTQSELPVLVDFWAEWCGPCHALAPTIAQIAREYKGRMLVVKVNVDERQSVAARYQIQSIPTVMIFHQGRTLARQSGALPYPALRQMVEHALGTATTT
jgi:thioredoxin 1